MASLAEKESLKNQVQMIYLDPPYGIKFGSNWQVSTQQRDVKDGKAEDCTRQPEQIKAFRDTWELGIHSYLAYLRDRLVVARELLTDSGSIFVQIGDENVHLVRCLLDEVFGSGNFVRQIIVQKTGGLVQDFLPRTCDILLWYRKQNENTKFNRLFLNRTDSPADYQYIKLSDGTIRSIATEEKTGALSIPKDSKLFSTTSLESANPLFTFEFNGVGYSQRWKTNLLGLNRLAIASRVSDAGKTLRYVRFFDDFPVGELQDVWSDTMGERNIVYVVQTNTKIIERCLLMTTDPGDLVLDPTCGSGTTAYVAEQWGRRWITCDTSRVALALARTRLMSAKYPYYLLADSKDGIQKLAQLQGKLPETNQKPKLNIKHGFVYKTVPHITLKAIANNQEIDVIHDKWQTQLEPLRQEINTLLNQNWQEWEIPREPATDWDKKAKDFTR
jgi:adenine-specific DNA-methyltransferase